MIARHAAAALAWASLLTMGNVHVTSVVPPPRCLTQSRPRPGLVMQAREVHFESTRSPVAEEASVIPDHLVLPGGDALLRPHVPAPRTRRGWAYPVPEDPSLLPNPIQAGWFAGWTLALPGGGPLPSPAVRDGVVYLSGGPETRDVHALDAATGIPLWTIRLSEEGPGEPVISDRTLVLSTAAGTTFALSTFDGGMIWSRRYPGAHASTPLVTAELVVRGVTGADGDLLVASALTDGAPHWEAPLDGAVVGSPTLQDAAIYVTTTEGSIYCFDVDTGMERWSEPLGAWGPVRVDGSRIYVGCENPWATPGDGDSPGLLRVTLSVGLPFERVVWGQRETGDPMRLVSRLSVGTGFSGVPAAGYPLLAGARVEAAGDKPPPGDAGGGRARPWLSGDDVCVAGPGTIRCADLRTGSLRWDWAPPSDMGAAGVAGTPAVHDALVVAASTRGDLAGLRRRDGEVQWTLRLGDPVMTGPILHDGWLYVTTTTGRVFGVDLLETEGFGSTLD